jgi:acyl-coenzyme A synthetase/AMP-(fatty) acid ligase
MSQLVDPISEMKPDPILAAIDGYRGTIVDLETSTTVLPEEFARGWRELARRMNDVGLQVGDRVILAYGNGPGFIACWAAVLAQGGSPLFVHVDTPPAELRRMVQRFRARFIVTDAIEVSKLEEVGAWATKLHGPRWAPVVWADFGDLIDPGDGQFYELPGVPLHPTSGTTGTPKVAVRPAATAIAEVTNYVETVGVDEGDTMLAAAPMSHAFAHGWCVVTPMLTHADVVTMRRFNEKKVFEACQQFGISIFPAAAPMLNTLLFGAGDRLYKPTRRVFTGGAPLLQRIAANFERVSGSPVRPLYGSTETGAIAVARAHDPTAIGGCVGAPFCGVTVELRTPKDCSEYGEGVGLVHVRSESLMAGYLVDERLEKAAVEDGWFNTGDLGWFDDQGSLHLMGRQAEVINVSGMKVLPREVEEVILSLSGVEEVKVYPGETRLGSHHVKAAVVARGDVGVAQVQSHCEEHLVYFKRPARIVLMDKLPRLANGKIAVQELP